MRQAATETNKLDLLTIAEVAELLRKSKSVVHKRWPRWVAEYGLRPIRFGGSPRGRLLFSRAEIEAMLEQWRIR